MCSLVSNLVSVLPRDPSNFEIPGYPDHLIHMFGYGYHLRSFEGVTASLIAKAQAHNPYLGAGNGLIIRDYANRVDLEVGNSINKGSLDFDQWEALARVLQQFGREWECVGLAFTVISVPWEEEVAWGAISRLGGPGRLQPRLA